MLLQSPQPVAGEQKFQQPTIRVSIIIPAYNAAQTIGETLASVLAQTVSDWEAIIVNDGSTDRTVDVVASIARQDSRITIVSRPNGGESAARNTGLKHASNDWILFLDADDWIAPNYLERVTIELIDHPEFDAVHCGSARVAEDRTAVVEQYLPPAGDLFPVLARRAAFPIHACVVRKELIEAVGNFDTSLTKSPDWDLWQRIARTGARFGAVRDVLAFYRMRANAASLDAPEMLKDGLRVLRRGHSADPRVSNPNPAYINGYQEQTIQSQEFYLLCWCAGLLLGQGSDATHLLAEVSEHEFPELYPEAVAQCIFDAAPLPTCQAPRGWEQLWNLNQEPVAKFLAALEQQSQAPNLAASAMKSLKRMILKHSESWGPIVDDLEREKGALQRRQEELTQSIASLGNERLQLQQQVTEREQTIVDQKISIKELRASVSALSAENTGLATEGQRLRTLSIELEKRAGELEATVSALDQERNHLLNSHERRLGDFLLNRLHVRGGALAIEHLWASFRHWLECRRLAFAARLVRKGGPRVIATVCDSFPIYSQTFVYQELMQLIRSEFDVRLVYSKLDSRDYLPSDFGELWKAKRRLHLNRKVHERDYKRFLNRMPDKVESLTQLLCEASGLDRDALVHHDNFLQAFSFTRMVEAYKTDYLHSYFFYDRSLMAMVAGYLLGIPRGVSCYADHLLKDYELKVVPLHLDLCDVIVATSERIKRELLEIAPETNSRNILVKPNAVDAQRFPQLSRKEPVDDEPFRLVSVCRIEPKKGLLDLVEAMHLLKQSGPRVELHLVGTVDEWSLASREYKRRLDQRISELNLWGTVHLEGRQNLEGILRFLQISHLFVAPFVETGTGDKDGIPTALLEALSTGLPAVATTTGSITEVIEDGRNGVLVPEHDPIQLANAIALLLRDAEKRKQLGIEAAERIRRNYEINVCERLLHDRVNAVIAARTTAASNKIHHSAAAAL